MFIKDIRIRNFRSILNADLPLSDLTILVGLNDVGKSNVLKALNLFFNSETDYGKSFNFNDDYSKYSPKRNKKAEEITVELILHRPANYKGAKDIRWVKVWRKDGLHLEDIKFSDNTLFPKKSKLYSWVHSIRYAYIPAIRDNEYFKSLLGRLHDSLAETIETELREAGDDFIAKVRKNTASLISDIDERLSIKSEIRLPPNLSSLFKTLDFLTTHGNFQVSLTSRGDGIKTRHIPIIHKFISEQVNINRTKGSPNVNTIWGYEEPENNLELLASFDLAKEFCKYSESIQTLVTTHSPAFYMLRSDRSDIVNLYSVIKQKGSPSELRPIQDIQELHENMGVMPLVAPAIESKVREIQSLKDDIEDYKFKLSQSDNDVIFVEGGEEMIVFSAILEHQNEKRIAISEDLFGCSGVRNQIMAWSWVAGTSSLKACGVFDNDVPGCREHDKLTNDKQYQHAHGNGKVNALKYKVPHHLRNLKNRVPLFPIELEEMFGPQYWRHAEEKGWLVERKPECLIEMIKVDSADQTINDKIDKFELSDDELRYLKYQIDDRHKKKFANFFARKLDHSDYSLASKPLIDFVRKISEFLLG
ncbi:MAG: ATP-dependent endonuclease [Cyclobacteriaceae bacterium]